MTILKKKFVIPLDDLQKLIDIDDSTGRSVPINMNFTDSGYLTKDQGIALFGASEANLTHSLYYYKKKDGTGYILRGKDTKLQVYNYQRYVSADNTTDFFDTRVLMGTGITITIATPGVITSNNHNLIAGDTVQFTTTGALPTGLSANTDYYVISSGLTTNTFQVSATSGGSAINTTGTQSGTHSLYKTKNRKHGFSNGDQILFSNSSTGILPSGITSTTSYYIINKTDYTFQVSLTSGGSAVNFTTNGTANFYFRAKTPVWDNLEPTFTALEEFGFYVYNDILYGSNSVENLFSWDGSEFREYASAPKGNVLEVFEDRLFVTGVKAQPLSLYYSDTGVPTTFQSTSVVSPLGTDTVQTLKNYYGTLLVFKTESIWKLTFVYNQVTDVFEVKIELQSNKYGACSRKAVSWVENDIWFFTGREVRAIGFKDNQIGVFGVNQSVISENIKETLKLINKDSFSKCVCFYTNRRFYLGIPLTSQTVDTVFVCHTLYKNSWTKYTNREKARINDMIVVDEIIYSNISSGNYGTIQWTTDLDDEGVTTSPINSEVFFERFEDQDFNRYRIYRYLNLLFKDLQAVVKVTIREEREGIVQDKTREFYVGNVVEGELNTLGEVEAGAMLAGDSYGETVVASPFVKQKVSFLSKSQALIIGLSNNNLGESFTIAKMNIVGFENEPKMFSAGRIISAN
jgi:hypothetical protein